MARGQSQAATRGAQTRRLLGQPAKRPRVGLYQAEIHKQTGPQEAGRQALAKGLAGQDLVPESQNEVAEQQGARDDEVQESSQTATAYQ